MRVGSILLLFAVLFWGWSFVATKIVLGYLSVGEIIALRLVIAVPLLAAIASVRRVWPRRRHAGDTRTVFAAAMILLLHWSVQFAGIRMTTATNSGWMVGAAPISIILFASLFLHERITRLQVAGMAIASAGILLLVSRGNFSSLDWLSNTGDWLVLSSIFIWGSYTAVTRDISRRHDPLAVITVILATCGVAAIVYLLAAADPQAIPSLPSEAIVALLFLGIASTALAFWFWQEGVARLGASRSGYFLYGIPLATTALAVPYLGDPFGGPAALGGALIVGGVFLAERRHGAGENGDAPTGRCSPTRRS